MQKLDKVFKLLIKNNYLLNNFFLKYYNHYNIYIMSNKRLQIVKKNKDNKYLDHLNEIFNDDITLLIYDYIPYINTSYKPYIRDLYILHSMGNVIRDDFSTLVTLMILMEDYDYYIVKCINKIDQRLCLFDHIHKKRVHKYIYL